MVVGIGIEFVDSGLPHPPNLSVRGLVRLALENSVDKFVEGGAVKYEFGGFSRLFWGIY